MRWDAGCVVTGGGTYTTTIRHAGPSWNAASARGFVRGVAKIQERSHELLMGATDVIIATNRHTLATRVREAHDIRWRARSVRVGLLTIQGTPRAVPNGTAETKPVNACGAASGTSHMDMVLGAKHAVGSPAADIQDTRARGEHKERGCRAYTAGKVCQKKDRTGNA